MFRLTLAATLGTFLAACQSADVPETRNPTSPPVGITRLALEDPARLSWDGTTARPVVTTVWYPAQDGAVMEAIAFPADQPIFTAGTAARDAATTKDGPYPLVLLSHGTGGAALQMMWLGRALAEEGYIAAAVDHHGNTAAEDSFDPRGFRIWWERSKDLTYALDALIEDETFGPLIDQDRLGAAGFSLGGYTVTALAGGQTERELFRAFCASEQADATCQPQPEYPNADEDLEALIEADPSIVRQLQGYKTPVTDPRIDSFVMIAPALGTVFTPQSLTGIEKPALVIVGTEDDTTPAATNGALIAAGIPDAELILIEGASHYTYLNTCTPHGQAFVPVCEDAGRPRTEIHTETIALVLDHFVTTLAAPVED